VATPALDPRRYLRSVAASAATLGKPHVKLLDLVDRVRLLIGDAPYAIVGGLAQILWARKTHTDDFDAAIASTDPDRAFERVKRGRAPRGWRLPTPPDVAHESDDVFEVLHLLYRGSVVDLISFHDTAFLEEIIATAQPIAEVGGHRFIRPELLLVTHLLRPGRIAEQAAIDLLLHRREAGDFDDACADRWSAHMRCSQRLARVRARVAE
jgi:hypothetical protein